MPEPFVKKNEFYSTQEDGAVEFPQKGREELGPMLLELGVKFDDIRLKSQLDSAIKVSAGYPHRRRCGVNAA